MLKETLNAIGDIPVAFHFYTAWLSLNFATYLLAVS
jgi:hypothetical protein